MQDVSN